MFKKILETIGTRYLIALLNLVLIFVNAKVLGMEGVGMVGLIIASINIAIIFNGIFAGNTLVYFMKRYPIRQLFIPAYCWSFIGSALACGFLFLTRLLPLDFWLDIYLLSILSSLITANSRFLLGKDNVKGFNITYMLQGGLLFFVLLYIYYIANRTEVKDYLYGLYITYSIAWVISLYLLKPYLQKQTKNTSYKPSFRQCKEMFVYGLWAGADNLAETLTTRLNYFLVERFAGLSGVGLLDAGSKVSESVWHISRSVSVIAYSEVAKAELPEKQRKVTLQLFKLTIIALVLVMSCILCIPEWVYTDYLFSAEFVGIRKVIIALSLGIVTLGGNSILSHFFIGSGRIRISTACSCVGLISLLIAGHILIPVYGITGAALTSSIAFSCMLLFSITVFIRITQSSLRDFIFNREDFNFIRLKIQGWKQKRG